jgi:hypothetical protein
VSNPRRATPSYLFHKQSGRARAVWTDRTGVRHQKLLPGGYESPESLTAFAKLQAEVAASAVAALNVVASPNGVTVNKVLLAYIGHALQQYRGEDGEPGDELRHIKTVCRYVREMYGNTHAAEFGPKALKAVRERFVAENWCRTTVNSRVERVRRIFKWAVAEELVPPSVHQALAAVPGLRRGRTPTRESAPVGPGDDALVDATLPHLNRHVRGLVEFQRLTGCRPGAVLRPRRERAGVVVQARAPQDRVEGQGPHHPHRAEGSGVAQAILHPGHPRLPVLSAAGGRGVPRRAERGREDPALAVSRGAEPGEEGGGEADATARRAVQPSELSRPHRRGPSGGSWLPPIRGRRTARRGS